MKKITEAQIYLTRGCNLRCGYCKLPYGMLAELELSQWKAVYDNLARIGIKTVKLLGGEPTIKPWLPELLEYSAQKSIKTAVLSNSTCSEETLNALVDAGLWGYYASVDSLEIGAGDMLKKSRRGIDTLCRLKKLGVPLVSANIVISKANIFEIQEIVKTLSGYGIWSNVCVIQHTENEKKCFSQPTIDPALLFGDGDKGMLETLAQGLVSLKNRGVKISTPESYLRGMTQYGIHCDWQCREMSQLRIDADGGMMICNEYRTVLADTFNAVTLTPERVVKFCREWPIHRNTITCDGCYWSCFIQAEDNLRHGRLEFDFIADD